MTCVRRALIIVFLITVHLPLTDLFFDKIVSGISKAVSTVGGMVKKVVSNVPFVGGIAGGLMDKFMPGFGGAPVSAAAAPGAPGGGGGAPGGGGDGGAQMMGMMASAMRSLGDTTEIKNVMLQSRREMRMNLNRMRRGITKDIGGKITKSKDEILNQMNKDKTKILGTMQRNLDRTVSEFEKTRGQMTRFQQENRRLILSAQRDVIKTVKRQGAEIIFGLEQLRRQSARQFKETKQQMTQIQSSIEEQTQVMERNFQDVYKGQQKILDEIRGVVNDLKSTLAMKIGLGGFKDFESEVQTLMETYTRYMGDDEEDEEIDVTGEALNQFYAQCRKKDLKTEINNVLNDFSDTNPTTGFAKSLSEAAHVTEVRQLQSRLFDTVRMTVDLMNLCSFDPNTKTMSDEEEQETTTENAQVDVKRRYLRQEVASILEKATIVFFDLEEKYFHDAYMRYQLVAEFQDIYLTFPAGQKCIPCKFKFQFNVVDLPTALWDGAIECRDDASVRNASATAVASGDSFNTELKTVTVPQKGKTKPTEQQRILLRPRPEFHNERVVDDGEDNTVPEQLPSFVASATTAPMIYRKLRMGDNPFALVQLMNSKRELLKAVPVFSGADDTLRWMNMNKDKSSVRNFKQAAQAPFEIKIEPTEDFLIPGYSKTARMRVNVKFTVQDLGKALRWQVPDFSAITLQAAADNNLDEVASGQIDTFDTMDVANSVVEKKKYIMTLMIVCGSLGGLGFLATIALIVILIVNKRNTGEFGLKFWEGSSTDDSPADPTADRRPSMPERAVQRVTSLGSALGSTSSNKTKGKARKSKGAKAGAKSPKVRKRPSEN